MTELPPPPAAPVPPVTGGRLVAAVTGMGLFAVLGDLFALLLLPTRVGGHLVPAGPALVFVLNAGIGFAGVRLLGSRLPAQVVLGVAILLSVTAAGRGPGGDLFVTRDLQGMYLLFVLTAALGASVPLFFRRRG